MGENVQRNLAHPDSEEAQELMREVRWVQSIMMPELVGYQEGNRMLMLAQALVIFSGIILGRLKAIGMIDDKDIDDMIHNGIVVNLLQAVEVGVEEAAHRCECCEGAHKRLVN